MMRFMGLAVRHANLIWLLSLAFIFAIIALFAVSPEPVLAWPHATGP